jgi:putative CocE/NonD family hydrolase
MVQWLAATQGSPHLKTIVPRVMGTNLHESPHYTGGAFQLGVNATWSFRTSGRTMQRIDHYNWDELFRFLPLRKIDRAAGRDIKHFRDWIAHPSYDEYWRAISVHERYSDIEIPIMQFGGWYDLYSGAMMESFCGMREQDGSLLARENQKIIMGPWIHSASSLSYAGEVDFGMTSILDLRSIELRWFDRWLKGISNGIDKEPPIKIFVMGANVWREENEWPPKRTAFTPYYLRSRGKANSLRGDGGLSPDAPGNEPHDRFTYDPQNPVPTSGGCNCCNPEIVAWGAYDQREIEAREDVLVYTSEPLKEDLEVTGPVRVKLYASTDAPDTDFTAKLVDVHPSGYAINLTDGIRRGRYRESVATPKLLEPGKVYEFDIDLWVTSNVFLKGHRIRVEISSSNFPRFDRNPNTGGEFGADNELRVAHQQIYHDREYPSHIILPVIPG